LIRQDFGVGPVVAESSLENPSLVLSDRVFGGEGLAIFQDTDGRRSEGRSAPRGSCAFMPGSWIIDIRHLTEHDPDFEMPSRMLKRRDFYGHVIRAATATSDSMFLSVIPCRRRPGRVACPGLLCVAKTNLPEPFIFWECVTCDDNGRISGFRNSWYDLSKSVPPERPPNDTLVALGVTFEEHASWISGDLISYDQESLVLIYSARVSGRQIRVCGDDDEMVTLLEATAADTNHETKRPRRERLRAILRKLEKTLALK